MAVMRFVLNSRFRRRFLSGACGVSAINVVIAKPETPQRKRASTSESRDSQAETRTSGAGG